MKFTYDPIAGQALEEHYRIYAEVIDYISR